MLGAFRKTSSLALALVMVVLLSAAVASRAAALLAHITNRVNNHQNNLRLGVGAAYHFGTP
jgi:hypothetical protein